MTEHLHDPDIILGLASGTVTAADEAAALAGIASCARCTEDLEMQRSAMVALSGLSPARLEPGERAELRADLRTALGLDEVAVPARRAGTARQWRPLWGLATAAAVLVGVMVLPSAFRALSSGDSGDEFYAAAETSTTAAEPAPDAAALSSRESSEAPLETTAQDAAGDDGVAGGAAIAGSNDGGLGTDSVLEDGATIALPPVVLAPPGDLAAEFRELETTGSLRGEAGAPSAAIAPTLVESCRSQIVGGEAGYPVAVTEVDGVPALLMAYPLQDGLRLIAQSLEDCAPLVAAGS